MKRLIKNGWDLRSLILKFLMYVCLQAWRKDSEFRIRTSFAILVLSKAFDLCVHALD